jgi:radical SAM superfamily enzyme YgiQ (UPF0313 family)
MGQNENREKESDLRVLPRLSNDGVEIYGRKIGDVVLVQLYSDLQQSNAEPFAVETLAGALEDNIPDINCNIALADPRIESRNPRSLVDLLSENPPKIIGMSVPQGTLPLALDMCKQISENKVFNGSQLVLGHAVPTYSEDTFKNVSPEIKIIRGWGEKEFIEIVRNNLGKIAVEACQNPKYSIPVRIGKEKEFFRRIEASRGCGYGVCAFCARPYNTAGPKITHNAIEGLRKQLDQMKAIGETSFGFSDEDFMGKVENIEEFTELFKQYDFSFSAAMRVETVVPYDDNLKIQRKEDIQRLASSGLKLVFLGVESFVTSQQKRYNKHLIGGTESCLQAIKILDNAGASIDLGLIVFDPEVSVDELRENAKVLIDNDIYKYLDHPFGTLSLRPGSRLEKQYNPPKDMLDLNMLEYGWKFKNEDAKYVYQLCNQWWKPLMPAYKSVRDLYRFWTLPNEDFRDCLKDNLDIIRYQMVCVLNDAAYGKDDFTSETNIVMASVDRINQLAKEKF